MSDNIKPVELSSEDLDTVAGGAVSFVFGDNTNVLDQQVGSTALGANGGIVTSNAQQSAFSRQQLNEIKATDVIPGVPGNFFPVK